MRHHWQVTVAKLTGAGLLIALWLGWTLFAWLVASLMSVDEEWDGWSDVLLNPFSVGVYVAVTAALLLPSFLMLRRVWARSR